MSTIAAESNVFIGGAVPGTGDGGGGPGPDPGPVNPLLVEVRELGDLPSPNGSDEIVLVDGAAYHFLDDVDIGANVLVAGVATTLIGVAPGPCKILGSGAELIRAAQGVTVEQLELTAPSGDACSFDGSGMYILTNVIFRDCARAVDCGAAGRFLVDHIRLVDCAQGLRFTGLVPFGRVLKLQAVAAALAVGFVGFDVASTAEFGSFLVGDSVIELAAAGQTAINIDPLAAVTGDELLLFSRNVVTPGAGVALAGSDKQRVGLFFRDNEGLQDSLRVGILAFSGNTQATPTPNLDEFVDVNTNAPYVLVAESERFQSVVEGSITVLEYIGRRPFQANIRALANARRTAAPNVNGTMRLMRKPTGGVYAELVGVRGMGQLRNSDGTLVASVFAELNLGDRVKIEVANNTNTTDIRLSSLYVQAS